MTNGFPTTGATPMTSGVRMTKVLSGTAARVVTASLAIALLAACGGTSTAKSPTPTAASSPSAVGTKVGVTEKEFSITLDRTSFSPGTYSFAIQNQGRYAHNLKISGPGVTSTGSSVMAGGQSGSLTVTLQKGTYQLWCGVPGHKDKGMVTTITVG